jgi:very-short-patch-repair endonuclease
MQKRAIGVAKQCNHKREIVIKCCEECGKEIPISTKDGFADYQRKRFCGNSCAAKHNNKGHTHTPESKIKISNSVRERYTQQAGKQQNECGAHINFNEYVDGAKDLYVQGIVTYRNLKYYKLDKVEGVDFVICPYCNTRLSNINASHLKQHNKTINDLKSEFGESYVTTSETSREKRSKIGTEVQKRLIAEGKHIGWKTRKIRSYAELFWERVLKNNKLQYEPEYTLKKTEIGINEQGCYFLDFLIDGYIDLEIDGKQHQYEERKEHDTLRDERLTMNGFIIYRIPWINPVESERVKQQIDDFLMWYADLKKSEPELQVNNTI